MAEELGQAAAPATYEYAAIRADRDLESLYRDTYVNFGWTVEGYGQALPSTGTVNLKLKRPRHLKNRPEVVQLQRKAEQALAEIAALEKSKTTSAFATSVGSASSAAPSWRGRCSRSRRDAGACRSPWEGSA
jgi:hypothetical protein